VAYNPNASSSRPIGRQVRGSGQVLASEFHVLFIRSDFAR
jgi:hypothetical protein